LVGVRATDEEDRTIFGDIEGASRSDLSEEDIDDEPPKDEY
jgi:hypothetical protein